MSTTVHGPDFIALQVRDVEAAARFYEEHLGLRRAPAAPPGAVVFDTRPIPFAVRGLLPGVDLDGVAQPGLGVALWFAADDAQGLHDRLAAAGVPVVRAPEDGPFGRTFTFTGPEGYAVTVHGG
ncbi:MULTISPECIES: VOC family protein [unclassified Streptomyces]|uniref:VOC family protein n=1 Tax=Streptomyces TaxID=1883 RepID=UPI0001C1A327|nr:MULTISPECIES: VOC family protein [unclassified Streptomyces]AEN13472.1 Glyoxalase/bleomycin resistance protein/dioxygenase [Streptomyces sp. SirexAA-E]MYR64464.1 VOC family protein [Streptomyces sp. SID4939]MYS02518.1 VOC family protein [Streptomyces sp. SID4940]MYT67080.1 VOC family protein [Streptomyces sp. SID8357]MYT84724.1 VOC family protein [Streptomyces sp. SID8360]